MSLVPHSRSLPFRSSVAALPPWTGANLRLRPTSPTHFANPPCIVHALTFDEVSSCCCLGNLPGLTRSLGEPDQNGSRTVTTVADKGASLCTALYAFPGLFEQRGTQKLDIKGVVGFRPWTSYSSRVAATFQRAAKVWGGYVYSFICCLRVFLIARLS